MYETTPWENRIVEFPNRFTKTAESNTEITLTQAPGTVTKVGTAISASNMNKIEQGLFDAQLLGYMGGF